MELDPRSASSEIIEALSSIRSRISSSGIKKKSTIEVLIKTNAVSKLVSLLTRPNSKIVDLSLSVLATLLLEEIPRNQIRQRKGIEIILGIVGTLGEESIISRACRALANMALHPKNVAIMFEEGILPLFLKTLSEISSPRTQQVIVRALRLLGSAGNRYKKKILEGGVVIAVSDLLKSTDKELLRAVTRCLSHFAHGGDLAAATQIQGDSGRGFQRLVELVKSGDCRISEYSFSTLINLSHVESVRPNLGNAGTVSVLVQKVSQSKSSTEITQGITALCLFCRESVNRMKLRDSGGLKLFVEVLKDEGNSSLHDRILQSLLQFNYDNLGLKVLQHYELIPALLNLLNESEDEDRHSCEVEISMSSEKKSESIISEDEPINVPSESIDQSLPPPPSTPPPYQEDVHMEHISDGEHDDNQQGSNEDVQQRDEMSNSTKRSGILFRVDSPSYQEVQQEFQRFLKVRDNVMDFEDSSYPSSLCQSPDRSPWSSPSSRGGYSPASTTSSGYSPCGSTMGSSSWSSPKYSSYAPLTEDEDSNQSDTPKTEEGLRVYSPIERYSETEEEEEDNEIEGEKEPEEPVPSTSFGPPPSKRVRISSPRINVPKVQSIFESPSGILSPTLSKNSSFSFKKEGKISSNRNAWIFQILSRLSQSEKPHEHMASLNTTQTLVRHLFKMSDPGESRVARIMLRLSRNLYVFMSFVYQLQLPWLRKAFDDFCTLKDSPCSRCQKLRAFLNSFSTNVSLLAETGYAEGEMCHNLLRGSLSEKRAIAISIPFVARPRRLLRNLLLNHDGLEIIFEVLENSSSMSEDTFAHSISSLNALASHLGVINPNLTLLPGRSASKKKCQYNSEEMLDSVIFLLDDGSEVLADKSVLTKKSEVFEAMFVGSFIEAGKKAVKLPFTSRRGLECLLHYLQNCDWKCPKFQEEMSVKTLLELLTISDKYLLEEFNVSVSREIIKRCLRGGNDIIEIYRNALLIDYPVKGLEVDSLAKSTLLYLLVGTMSNEKRCGMAYTLLNSPLKNDFIDDVIKIITAKLNEL